MRRRLSCDESNAGSVSACAVRARTDSLAPCAAPLSTTATSRPAPSSWTSPAGRCPCSTPTACARSTWPCASAAASSTSRTWARSKPSVRRRRGAVAAAALERCLADRDRRRAVQRAVRRAGRRARRPVHLSPGARRYLTVTNASNHERDLAWFRSHARRLRRRAARPYRRLRDARRPGSAGARDRAGRSPTRLCRLA